MKKAIRHIIAGICIILAVIGIFIPFMPTYDFVLLAIIAVGLESPLGAKLSRMIPTRLQKYLTKKPRKDEEWPS